ncbi:competence type IV pilus major pilin ComGC [Solibacillus palustris]
MKNEKGFTLVEMLVVLFIISILILITIPNVSKHFATIDEKGCDSYVLMLNGQIEAYRISTGDYPASFKELFDNGYITEEVPKCPNKTVITFNGKMATIPNDSSLP